MILVLVNSAWAATLDVCPTCAYTTIGDAVAASAAGDTVSVAAGTYGEAVIIRRKLTLIGTGSATTFLTWDGPEPLIELRGVAVGVTGFTLQPLGPGAAVQANPGSSVVLSDIVGDGSLTTEAGGCVIADNATLEIDDSTFDQCASASQGGAIAANNTTVTVLRSTFRSCTSPGGGAMALSGGTLDLEDSVLDGNSADGDGGSVYAPGTSVTIARTTFHANAAQGGARHGGAVSVDYGSLDVAASDFDANTVDGWAATLYASNTPMTVTDSSFTNNVGGSGIVYELGAADIVFADNVFTDNTGEDVGGLVWYGGGPRSSLTITDSRFEGNHSGNLAGAVYVENCGTVTATGNTFSGNDAVHQGGAWWAASLWGPSCDKLVLSDNRFCDNHSDLGGAVYLSGRTDPDSSRWDHSVFAENEAAAAGGAMYLAGAASTIANDDFFANTAPSGAGGGVYTSAETVVVDNVFAWQANGGAVVAEQVALSSVSVEYNDLYQDADVELGGILGTPSSTNLAVDPGIAWQPGDPCDDPVTLSPSSPLVDAGDPSRPDPDGTAPDIGADRPVRDLDADGVDNRTDCDDTNAAIFPGATEICDGADDDCDGQTDEDAIDPSQWYADHDGDGFGSTPGLVGCAGGPGEVANGTDCDDTRWNVNPDVVERCDGVDQDCDGVVDDDPSDGTEFFVDADGDGYGAGTAFTRCSAAEGEVEDDTDCDDTSAATHPGAADAAGDGIDEDCDGSDPPAPPDTDAGDTDAGGHKCGCVSTGTSAPAFLTLLVASLVRRRRR